jgi:hypothetical protein
MKNKNRAETARTFKTENFSYLNNRRCGFPRMASLSAGRCLSLLTSFEATEKVIDFRFFLATAVDFRKWLRFPRGAAGASSATPAGSPPSASSLRSLRLLLQSPARNQ